jgi:predicted alpha/beta superfamily hydrolase
MTIPQNIRSFTVWTGQLMKTLSMLLAWSSFNNFPWVDRMPKSIVVGIASTRRKFNFTTPSSRPSDLKLIPENGCVMAFISFIADELQPCINKKFATDGNNMLSGNRIPKSSVRRKIN